MNLSLVIVGAVISGAIGSGCAGVKPQAPTGAAATGGSTGAGGTGNVPSSAIPEIVGITSLTVVPDAANVALTGNNGQLSGTQQLTASGVIGGVGGDVTTKVKWTSSLPGATINTTSAPGLVTINAPGTYIITATARDGSAIVMASATLTANFSGSVFAPGFTMSNQTPLDGNPAAQGTTLAYPLDHALFPSNLSPVYAQIQGTGTSARITFAGGGTDVKYYANCEAGSAGGGCAVKLPLSLTKLLIGPSAAGDMMMTARVLKAGSSAPAETQTISVAWSNVALSGGLYYWSTIPNPNQKPKGDTSGTPTPPKYILLDPKENANQVYSGTAIYRYAFTADDTDPAPLEVWTDDGGASSDPPYNGAPPAINGDVAKGHCIGCHAISNDGKYMALTLGGSAAEAANFALLDIGKQTLIQLSTNPNATATPTSNPVEYWKQFRMENLATENTWGPKSDRLVSMFKSQLFLTQLTLTDGTLMGTAARMGAVVPKWQAQEKYASDPFWSQDGKYFVFTSFATPNIGLYNDTGLNGDMKKGGQIVIATADDMGIHDDAKVLIGRGNGVTSYYPSISNDSQMVVFNTSTCATDPDPIKTAMDYGNQSCDGYDDSSAKLWVVSPTGGSSTLLGRANGEGAYGNSWPRFSPDKGTFRGQDLYWIAFSSRRPYGVQVNTGAAASTKPQLWIAGVTRGGEFVSDPSFAPVWLPAQNPTPTAPNGNHVPQWVKFAVVID